MMGNEALLSSPGQVPSGTVGSQRVSYGHRQCQVHLPDSSKGLLTAPRPWRRNLPPFSLQNKNRC